MKANTVEVFRGLSQLVPTQSIIMLVTGLVQSSTNRKTGDMVQTYVLHQTVDPLTALRTGVDAAQCGGCQHRVDYTYYKLHQVMRRTCYVQVGQAPMQLWKTWAKGVYPIVQGDADIAELGKNRLIRVGTYGDPTAVPLPIWQALLSKSTGHTGYTHQWKSPKFSDYKAFCQASVDTPEEAAKARAAGWGYFRVGPAENWSLITQEGLCPASEAAGKVVQCEACLRCSGVANKSQPSYIMIPAHGPSKNFVEGK